MVVNKRNRRSRARGQWTHGWGAKKKHRGSGNRGGFGNASTGKRADARKPSVWADLKYMGKYGFISKSRAVKTFSINLKFIEENIERLEKRGVAVKTDKTGQAYEINISKLGKNKLLGTGIITRKYNITADFASAGAIEKVASKGGKVNVLKAKLAGSKTSKSSAKKANGSEGSEA